MFDSTLSSRLLSESPADVRGAVEKIERQADECHLSLKIHKYSWNQAVWAMLSAVVVEIESVRSQIHAYNRRFLNALIVLGRVAALNIEWIRASNTRKPVPHTKFRSNSSLQAAASEMLNMGRAYSAFEASFPAWHQDLFKASLLAQNRVRFTNARNSVGDRRVSAWHKGIRPEASVKQQAGPGPIKPDASLDSFLEDTARRISPAGAHAINYPLTPALWERLTAEYHRRLQRQFRREREISLGSYTIAEFHNVYAALMALCSLHEFFHAYWASKVGNYPHASAVIVRARSQLIDKLSRISQISPEKLGYILSDLTFRDRRYDLHVHPLVPVADHDRLIAIAPHFPMDSNPEENILRMISHTRPEVYEATTSGL